MKSGKIESLYWIVLIVAIILAVLLILSFIGVGIKGPDMVQRDAETAVEERLKRLQDLRASTTVDPTTREERVNRMQNLRGEN